MIKINTYWKILTIAIALLYSCESEKRIPPKGYIPNKPMATEQLEAAYFWTPQDQLSSLYWKDANYVVVTLTDIATGNLYDEGYLNMTGTYKGLSDFNRGNDPKLTLKAGYDNEYIYILAEWKDTTANSSFMSWLFDGPSDSRKNDPSDGWTSQRNQDKFTFLFDLENSDGYDVWIWSLALSAPFNMAFDGNADEQQIINNEASTYLRNSIDNGSRTGPAYEWNGERQEITLADGTRKLLDPAYFMLEEMSMDFIGDVEKGQTVFNETADCKFCHGPNGNGDYLGSDGGRLNTASTLRISRESLVSYIGSFDHEGSSDQYWGRIKTEEQKQDLLAFMRGISGVPGYTISPPEIEPEIKALTNIGLGSISSQNSVYKLLLKRRLDTEKNENVVFTPDKVYNFKVRLSDNDGINSIGSSDIQLVFKSNEL